jgi:hypothetical protein
MRACVRCGATRRQVHHSEAVGGDACLGCHLAVSPREEHGEQRLVLQAEIAGAIRRNGSHDRRVLDRALLIQTATSTDEVLELLDEVAALGVLIETTGPS